MSRALALIGALVFVPAVSFAQQPCTTDARHVVNEIYRHVLERQADPGSSGWIDQLASNKGTVRSVVRGIVLSPEHAQRFGQGNNEESVGALYRHILGRQPDAAGLRTFAQVGANRGMQAVVDQMLGSAEYQQNFGDWGVPGSGGLRYCGPGSVSSSSSIPSGSAAQMRFRGMDTNADGMVSRSEWRGSARAFRVQDWNSDGVLSGDEVRVGGRERDVPIGDFDASNETRFEYLDVNNNGRVDRNEWDGSNQAFNRLDRNGDGRLTRAEVGTGTTSFANLDVNNDGRVSLDEWRWSRRAFENQDDNGDGYLTRREYRSGAVPTTGF